MIYIPLFILLSGAAISWWVWLLSRLFLLRLSPIEYLVGFVFLIIQFVGLLLLLTYLIDLLRAFRAKKEHKKNVTYNQLNLPNNLAFVSIHVPLRSEPVKMVKATLKSLSILDYSNYEVLVVYNNTPEKELWHPIKLYCKKLTKSSNIQFRFFYIKELSGFKSGALNFALKHTDPRAELIAIIDSDFIVESNFLRETVPYFENEKIGYVQAPQDYRFNTKRTFDRWCYFCYKYFFDICMAARNSRNGIIFVGTMGIIRKSTLINVGQWDEKCITEDAEFAIRVAKKGYKALFLNKSYGRGLMPFDFSDFKSQRYRWAFGGMQILRKHLLELWTPQKYNNSVKLTLIQRYDYSVCISQWLEGLISLVNVVFLLFFCILYSFKAKFIFYPITSTIFVIPIGIMYCRIAIFTWALKKLSNCRWTDSFGAIIALISLSWIVAWACLRGLSAKTGIFVRTNKFKIKNKNLDILLNTITETTISLLCIIIAILMMFHRQNNSNAHIILSIMAISQAMVYISALFMTLLSFSKYDK
jgi:cellulose synthase/poly-beta-1,6-N-acetylglucosamine synthase-like glycosyltransferase